MRHSAIIEAISQLQPDAKWTLSGTDLAGLVWISTDIARPSNDQILTLAASIDAKPNKIPLQVRIDYNFDKRLRVLEGKPAVTLAQFMAALKAIS